MDKKRNPCYNCNERNMKCHVNCEKYFNFIKENNKIKKIMKNEKILDSILKIN